MGFDPCNRPLNIQESIGTATPKMGIHLGMWRFIPSHSFALPGAWDVTHGLRSWHAPLQTFALVMIYLSNFEFCNYVYFMVVFIKDMKKHNNKG
jgi:hypothetical protein